MWWRSLAFYLGGGMLGTGFGLALGFLLFPFVFPPPPASEQLTEADRRERVVAEGRFIHANTSDPLHWGKGAVTVRSDSVFLAEDFEVGPGPKYHVYLVPKAQVRTSAEVSGQSFIDLGPPGLDLSTIQSVIIWCEYFSVLISPADLRKT